MSPCFAIQNQWCTHSLTNSKKLMIIYVYCIIKPNHKIISKLVVTVGSLQLNSFKIIKIIKTMQVQQYKKHATFVKVHQSILHYMYTVQIQQHIESEINEKTINTHGLDDQTCISKIAHIKVIRFRQNLWQEKKEGSGCNPRTSLAEAKRCPKSAANEGTEISLLAHTASLCKCSSFNFDLTFVVLTSFFPAFSSLSEIGL